MTAPEQPPSASVQLERFAAGKPDAATFFAAIARISSDLFGVGGQVGCALTLVQDRLPVTVSFSSPGALSLDEVQHFVGEGPSSQAIHTGSAVTSIDLLLESRWPLYAKILAGRGVVAVLGAPLTLLGGPQGSLNFYSATSGRFGSPEIEFAVRHAAEVSRYLAAAMQVTAWAIAATTLKFSVDDHSVINAAVGVVMGIRNTSRELAFTHLLALAQGSQSTLRTVSDDILQSLNPT